MTDKTFKDYLKEDAVDQEKHDALNNIAMTLGALETEIQELQRLDGDMDSSGVGDLTDQLTTMRKLVNSFEDVIDRATGVVPMESVTEAVDQALIDAVVDQIIRDIEMGDQTAIEELLKSCPEDNLKGFLSEVGESVNEEVIRIRAVKDKEDLKLPTTGINRKFDGPDAKEHAAIAKKQFEKDGYHVVYETNSKDLDYLKKLAGI